MPGKIPAAKAAPDNAPKTKISTVIALLETAEGASLDDLTKTTGWQSHSVRAALTGLRKKGHAIERSKRDGITIYRIMGSA